MRAFLSFFFSEMVRAGGFFSFFSRRFWPCGRPVLFLFLNPKKERKCGGVPGHAAAREKHFIKFTWPYAL